MKLEDLAVKSTCEVYTLRIPKDTKCRCLWAKITIDESAWMFSCVSDCGNFSHRWPTETNEKFKKFLTQIDMGYLMRKIEPRATIFNHEKTVENLKRTIFEYRREQSITANEAREAYEAITKVDYESQDILLDRITENSFWGDDYSWTADHFVYEHTPEAITFTEVVFPLLQKALKAELESYTN